MSSEASLGKKENNKSQDSQKIGSIHGPFMKGSVIQLGNGDIKNVEDLIKILNVILKINLLFLNCFYIQKTTIF